MTMDAVTLRVAELIETDPDLDIYRAIELARLETQAEASAARLAWAAFVCVPVIILVVIGALL